MGKKTKTGKQRKDKYYKLAKESGYRSRAAFKLLQLNRKYEFLQKSKVLIDLCAAPGGWMQVATQQMPVNSLVIGVDLVSIRNIPGTITLQEDITTDKCRQSLKKELQTWKADCVLHDGAPNIGQNWIQDAYQQNLLTLQALKLATEFLNKGGCFVTKVFRSKDYQSLIQVFHHLFKKVYATKPQASRIESAELFVVCQHYLAPPKVDKRLLDPHVVFLEDDLEPKNVINLLHPEKVKKRALGYPEGDFTLFHSLPVSKFIEENNFISVLSEASEFYIDEDWIKNHPATTPELLECLKDIKVLGRADLKGLLNWRKKLRAEIEKNKPAPEPVEEIVEDEEQLLQTEIENLKEEEIQKLKSKRKKELREKRKLQKQLQLKMVIPGDELVDADEELFSMKQLLNRKDLNKVQEQDVGEIELEEEDAESVKKKIAKYDRGAGERSSTGNFDESDSDVEQDDDSSDDDQLPDNLGLKEDSTYVSQDKDQEPDNPLVVDLQTKCVEERKKLRAEQWFDKDVFQDLEDEDLNEEFEMEEMVKNYTKQGGTLFTREKTDKRTNNAFNSDEDEDFDIEEEVEGKSVKSRPDTPSKPAGAGVVKRKLTPEDLALGSLLIKSAKTKRDITDNGWNRYAFNDENLPDWFAKDEEKNNRPVIEMTKELVAEYRERLREINARPIKKIVEAKARKKKRTERKMEKLRKKAETITDNLEMSDKEKSYQLKQLYKKLKLDKKPDVAYVVAKKHSAAKRARRPAGVKGPYKVVDSRMKKDKRAAKVLAKKANNRKSGKRPMGKKQSHRNKK